METTKKPSTRKPSKKSVALLLAAASITSACSAAPVADAAPVAPVAAPVASVAPDYVPPAFHYVSRLNLRRSVLNGTLKHCKTVMSDDDFRRITAAGLKHGVTWDEMLRALVTQQMHEPEPFKTTAKFLPLA